MKWDGQIGFETPDYMVFGGSDCGAEKGEECRWEGLGECSSKHDSKEQGGDGDDKRAVALVGRGN